MQKTVGSTWTEKSQTKCVAVERRVLLNCQKKAVWILLAQLCGEWWISSCVNWRVCVSTIEMIAFFFLSANKYADWLVYRTDQHYRIKKQTSADDHRQSWCDSSFFFLISISCICVSVWHFFFFWLGDFGLYGETNTRQISMCEFGFWYKYWTIRFEQHQNTFCDQW